MSGVYQGSQDSSSRGSSNKGWVSVKKGGEWSRHQLSPCKFKWNVDIQSLLSLDSLFIPTPELGRSNDCQVEGTSHGDFKGNVGKLEIDRLVGFEVPSTTLEVVRYETPSQRNQTKNGNWLKLSRERNLKLFQGKVEGLSFGHDPNGWHYLTQFAQQREEFNTLAREEDRSTKRWSGNF